MVSPLPELTHGVLIRRYKRFLVDIRLDNGDVITAHCTNSGSMLTCLVEGAEVYLSPVSDPKRKTQFTWEMIKINDLWIGINTSQPNQLAHRWISKGLIPGLEGYQTIQREVKYGDSRFDIYAERPNEKCFIEVKNVTLKDNKYARFPDARTERGQKHLTTLMKAKSEGFRAVMLYVIQRMDVKLFAPAWDIDPEYSSTLTKAHKAGVEIIPIRVRVTPQAIKLVDVVPFDLQ